MLKCNLVNSVKQKSWEIFWKEFIYCPKVTVVRRSNNNSQPQTLWITIRTKLFPLALSCFLWLCITEYFLLHFHHHFQCHKNNIISESAHNRMGKMWENFFFIKLREKFLYSYNFALFLHYFYVAQKFTLSRNNSSSDGISVISSYCSLLCGFLNFNKRFLLPLLTRSTSSNGILFVFLIFILLMNMEDLFCEWNIRLLSKQIRRVRMTQKIVIKMV